VLADWTLAWVFKRETISLGQLHKPREEFTEVTPPLGDDEQVGASVVATRR
jgi:NADH dehydrogenase